MKHTEKFILIIRYLLKEEGSAKTGAAFFYVNHSLVNLLFALFHLSHVVNPLPDPRPELLKNSAKHAAIATAKSISIHNDTFLSFILYSFYHCSLVIGKNKH